MAALDPIHWQAVTPPMRNLLRRIGECSFAGRFYLAGGTALALRLGHRRSVDLDFFSATDEVMLGTRREILNALAPLEPKAVEDVDGNLLLFIGGLHAGFFSYGYSLLEPTDSVEGVAVAGLLDVRLMKLDALITRGSRKDFYDLYCIAQRIPIPDLLSQGQAKYPHARDFPLMAVESMVLFDNADPDLQPHLFVDAPWDQVKRFFVEQAQGLGQTWFGDQEAGRDATHSPR